MDLRQLEYVVAVAETSSFTAAAARSYVGQSALSHQIGRLESELGVRLFDRTTHSVRITPVGEIVLAHARAALGSVAALRNDATSADGQARGRVRLGMTQSAMRLVDLVEMIRLLTERHPDVDLSVTVSHARDCLDRVLASELDLAVAARGPEPCPDHLVFDALAEPDTMVAVVGPDDVTGGNQSPAELAARGPFVMHDRHCELRRRIDDVFRVHGVEPRFSIEVGEVSETIRFARAGLGTAIVPRSFVGDAPDVVDLAEPDLELQVGVYTREDLRSTAVDAVTRLLGVVVG